MTPPPDLPHRNAAPTVRHDILCWRKKKVQWNKSQPYPTARDLQKSPDARRLLLLWRNRAQRQHDENATIDRSVSVAMVTILTSVGISSVASIALEPTQGNGGMWNMIPLFVGAALVLVTLRSVVHPHRDEAKALGHLIDGYDWELNKPDDHRST